MWCFEFLKFSPGRRVWLPCWHLTQAGSKYFQMRNVYQPIIGRSLLKLVLWRREKSILISVSHDNFLCVSGYRVSLLSSAVCHSVFRLDVSWAAGGIFVSCPNSTLVSKLKTHLHTTDQHQSWIGPFSFASPVWYLLLVRRCCNWWLESNMICVETNAEILASFARSVTLHCSALTLWWCVNSCNL